MRFLLYTDNHFCSTSSIVRQRGEKYSLRLENQIKSISWAEELSIKQNCDAVVCLGDFFDKCVLNDEELTALKDINWSCLPHYFIVGNHESSVDGLSYNSTKALERPNFKIVDKPIKGEIDNGIIIHFLPYVIESNRKSLKETLELNPLNKNIIFSHNDVKGIQMGPVISKDGYDINEIENCCALFLNGHIHNGMKFCKNGINLGNLTGKDFSEDAFKYSHCAYVLDTDTMQLESYENPYAFNFYKLEINFEQDIRELKNIKDNAILSIKCLDYLVDHLKEALEYHKDKIVESRVIITRETTDIDAVNIDELTMDHLAKFVEYCKEKIDNTKILDEELMEICH